MNVTEHEWVNPTTMKIKAVDSDGWTVTAHFSWPTEDEARDKADAALTRYATLPIREVLGTATQAGQMTRRIRPYVYLSRYWGPPTWWLPRCQVKVSSKRVTIMMGWLRRAYAATYVPRKGRVEDV